METVLYINGQIILPGRVVLYIGLVPVAVVWVFVGATFCATDPMQAIFHEKQLLRSLG
jgi:hypothetical protein